MKVEMSKKCTPMWREAHSKSTSTKHTTFGPLLEVEMSKKCTPLWREAHFQDVVLRGRREGFTWQSEQSGDFVAFPKTMASDLQRICKDAFSVAGAVQKRHVHERGWEVRALIS